MAGKTIKKGKANQEDQKGGMDIHITVHIPDSLLPQAEEIRDTVSERAKETVEEALKRESDTVAQVTKWQMLSKRIEDDEDFDNPEIVQAWEEMKTSALEFRKDFEFKNDK